MANVSWEEIRDAYSPHSIDDLWAREPVIDKTIRLLQQEPIITIVGTPHSGRPSVLRLIQERLAPCVTYSFLQYDDATDVEDFWQSLANDLISQPTGGTVQSTSSYKFPRDARQFFQDLTESGALYFLLDDFHELQGRTWEQAVLDTFQSLSNVPNLHIALAGDVYPCGENLGDNFPFGELTAPICLNEEVAETSLERYVRRTEEYGVSCSTGDIEYILETTGGEPVLMRYLCAEIAMLLASQENRRFGEGEIEEAKERVVNTAGNDLFCGQWLSLTFVEQQVLLIMKALLGYEPSYASRIRTELQSHTSLAEAPDTGLDIDLCRPLDLLTRRFILKKENRRYTFANMLFGDWLPEIPETMLPSLLSRELAALARSALYSSRLEGWLVEASIPLEKHNKEKLSEDLCLLARGRPETPRPVILHISDLQFGKDHAFTSTDPSSTQSLLYELKQGLDKCLEDHEVSHPNIVVISGDIASWAESPEYESAKQFIEELCGYLEIDRQHVVLVPGNHDVNFKLSRMAFLKVSNERTYELKEGSPDKEIYPLRFVHFKRFFEAIYQGRRQYSLDPEHMYSVHEFEDLGLLIVGFNSCHNIDHWVDNLKSRQGFICEQAIENARKEIEEIEKSRRVPYNPVVAVWHHNPFQIAGAADLLTNGNKVAEILGSKCRIALYGHIHQPHYMPKLAGTLQEYDVRCIGAGAIGVAMKHRGGTDREGVWSLSFNVIELDLDSLPDSRLYSFSANVTGRTVSRTLHWQALQWDGNKLWRDFELA
jgi:hypothetical protein